LIDITDASLDGYIEDGTGAFDWNNADQVFDFTTKLLQPLETHGRRLHETMAHWEGAVEGNPSEHRDFVRFWQKAETVILSRTLMRAPAQTARGEQDFDHGAISRSCFLRM
jgi:hypothetical protein